LLNFFKINCFIVVKSIQNTPIEQA